MPIWRQFASNLLTGNVSEH